MVSLDRVLRSLEDYPSLRVLDIRDGALFHDPHSSPPSRAFPLLEFLRIRSERVTVSTILSLLAFPPWTHVDIGIIHMQRHPQGKLFLPGSALDGVAALIDQVIIRSGLTSTIHGHTGGAERLRFTTSLREWGPSVRAIRLLARTRAPVSHLLLAQHPAPAQRRPAAFAGQTIFPAFPRLTHLAVHSRSIWCSELLDALRPPGPRRAPSSDSESAPLALPLLKDLAVGFATKRRSAISRTLRRGDIAHYADFDSVVFIHFRECCRTFDGVLDGRRTEGSRLSRMEFFSYEKGCMAKPRDSNPDPAVSHVDLAALRRALVDHETGPLWELVDGPVVFSGYRFFTQA